MSWQKLELLRIDTYLHHRPDSRSVIFYFECKLESIKTKFDSGFSEDQEHSKLRPFLIKFQAPETTRLKRLES